MFALHFWTLLATPPFLQCCFVCYGHQMNALYRYRSVLNNVVNKCPATQAICAPADAQEVCSQRCYLVSFGKILWIRLNAQTNNYVGLKQGMVLLKNKVTWYINQSLLLCFLTHSYMMTSSISGLSLRFVICRSSRLRGLLIMLVVYECTTFHTCRYTHCMRTACSRPTQCSLSGL